MSKDLLGGVYKIEGLYPDPYGVINVFRSASDEEKAELVKELKLSKLDKNQNIRREIRNFEHERDMSS